MRPLNIEKKVIDFNVMSVNIGKDRSQNWGDSAHRLEAKMVKYCGATLSEKNVIIVFYLSIFLQRRGPKCS